jgi:molybdopterin synthase sulfur carrier subunit
MTLTVNYFGLITDITRQQKELFSLEKETVSVYFLQSKIEEKYPAITEINFTIAVNQSVVTNDTVLKENDCIALLPPFAGG